MDAKEQEAIENDPILKKLRQSKTKNAANCLRNISLCLLDPDLLASQAFCVFLYGSCGAIAPYLPLYFKQIGLEPYQVGVILGIAPIIQCLVSPIWSVVANKWHVQKLVFLSGVLSFVVKLLLILAVQPRKQHCLQSYVNSTTNLTYIRSISLPDEMKNKEMTKWEVIIIKPPNVAKIPIKTTVGIPTVATTTTAGLKNFEMENDVSNRLMDAELMAESFGSLDGHGSRRLPPERDGSNVAKTTPAAHASHQLLKPIQKYDFQVSQEKAEARSVSKEFSKFDKSLNETVQYAITVEKYELYDIFLIFVMFVMVCDFLQAPTFALGDGSVLSRVQEHYQSNPTKMRLAGSIGWITAVLVVGAIVSRSIFVLCGGPRTSYFVAFYFSIGFVCMAFINALWFEYIYDQKADNEVETWKNSLRTLFDLKGIAFFIGLIYISLCSGFLAPFLNWYIDDLGGSTLVIATACATRECMVLVFYMVGNSLVPVLGRMNVIMSSLMAYAVCFFCYWFVQNLWVVVGIVAVEGAAFGLLWRSCEKYINHLRVSPEVSSITKSFLDALFWGVGNGGGALIGGALYGWIGGRNTFLTFGIVTIVMLFVVSTILMCRSKQDDGEINEPVNQTLGEEVSDVEE